MNCEICKAQGENFDTLTLCNNCFLRVHDQTLILIIENMALKFLVEKLLAEKKRGWRE